MILVGSHPDKVRTTLARFKPHSYVEAHESQVNMATVLQLADRSEMHYEHSSCNSSDSLLSRATAGPRPVWEGANNEHSARTIYGEQHRSGSLILYKIP